MTKQDKIKEIKKLVEQAEKISGKKIVFKEVWPFNKPTPEQAIKKNIKNAMKKVGLGHYIGEVEVEQKAPSKYIVDYPTKGVFFGRQMFSKLEQLLNAKIEFSFDHTHVRISFDFN